MNKDPHKKISLDSLLLSVLDFFLLNLAYFYKLHSVEIDRCILEGEKKVRKNIIHNRHHHQHSK